MLGRVADDLDGAAELSLAAIKRLRPVLDLVLFTDGNKVAVDSFEGDIVHVQERAMG